MPIKDNNAGKRPDSRRNGFSMQGFDVRHYKQTESYVQAIDQLYNTAIHSFSRLAGSVDVDPTKPFDFASRPAYQKRAQAIVNDLAMKMTAVIKDGSEKEWLYACKKNDAFLAHIMDTSKIGKRQLNKMQDRNLDALTAFQDRKVNGLDLSQRVWKYAGQMKGLMEMGIDIAVGDGRSAADLSRDLRQYLVEPDKLFRRVRDKHGNLQLSKRAAAYHPGQGVYRSSYKNALRLASTEINMAYRDSDRYRWNQMDFIVGYRVHLSNNHTLNGEPFHDICDELAGDYPKDFVFKGWHPNCRCFVTPILQDPDEFKTDELNEMKSAFFGTEYKKFQSRKTPKGLPDAFLAWVKDHKEESLKWKSQPYWIRDNFKGGTLAGELILKKPVIPKPVAKPKSYDTLTDEQKANIKNEWSSLYTRNMFEMICDAAKMYHVDDSLFVELDQSMPEAYQKMDQLKAEFNRLTAELDSVAARMKADLIAPFEMAKKNAVDEVIWGVILSPNIIQTWWNWTQSEGRWPNYPKLADNIADFNDRCPSLIERQKEKYNSVRDDAISIIRKAAPLGIATKTLWNILAKHPSESNPSSDLIREMKAEIKNIEDQITKKKEANGFDDIVGHIEKLKKEKNLKIDFNKVQKFKKQPTEQEIIERVGGGDDTKGSCSSLAFTYAANRGGLNVLDFRDGDSREYFANSIYIAEIAKKVGGVNSYATGLQMMKTTEIGKEYYLAIGRHAAIVRQTAKGKFEYLELQSAWDNGWHTLNRKMFEWRFKAYGSDFATMIEVKSLANEPTFQKLMGYINTADENQHKSKKGSIK